MVIVRSTTVCLLVMFLLALPFWLPLSSHLSCNVPVIIEETVHNLNLWFLLEIPFNVLGVRLSSYQIFVLAIHYSAIAPKYFPNNWISSFCQGRGVWSGGLDVHLLFSLSQWVCLLGIRAQIIIIPNKKLLTAFSLNTFLLAKGFMQS